MFQSMKWSIKKQESDHWSSLTAEDMLAIFEQQNFPS